MKTRKVSYKVRRVVHLKGTFIGKYRGEVNEENFDAVTERSTEYEIDIYEGVFTIDETQKEKPFPKLTNTTRQRVELPKSLLVRHAGREPEGWQYLRLFLKGIELENPTLSLVVQEEEQSFGTISGTLYAYVEDEVEKVMEIAIPPLLPESTLTPDSQGLTRQSGFSQDPKPEVLPKPPLPPKPPDPPKPLLPPKPPEPPKPLEPRLPIRERIRRTIQTAISIALLLLGLFLMGVFLFAIIMQGADFVMAMLGILMFVGSMLLFEFLISFLLRIFKYIIFTVLLLLILVAIAESISMDASVRIPDRIESAEERVVVEPEFGPVEDGSDEVEIVDSLIRHFRVWQDFYGRKYEGWLEVGARDMRKAEAARNTILSNNLNQVYSSLLVVDQNSVDRIYDMLDGLRTQRQLDPVRFVHCVVSMVQDIPYALILDGPCIANEYASDPFIHSYLQEGGVCRGYERYGLLSPSEFMGTLQGDCDTRSLLLYLLLQKFGYDVVMLLSDEYRHAMLGVNIPAKGTYKEYNRKKYYFWETTSMAPLGLLDRDYRNVNYWRVFQPILTE